MPLFGPVGDDWPPQCQVNMQMSLQGAPTRPGKGYFAVRGVIVRVNVSNP